MLLPHGIGQELIPRFHLRAIHCSTIPKMVYFTLHMWEVYEHRRAAKRLDGLSKDILKRYEKWKDIVRISGPQGLHLIKGFHDEHLQGQWKGHRSSRLGEQYRVIYTVEEHHVTVWVMDVTAHDYRRPS